MISSSPFFLSATSSSFSSQNSHRRVNLFHPRPTFHREIFSPQNRLIFVSTVSNELWHFPIFPIRLAMLIFPNKSRYGVSSPYVPSSISSYFQSLFITLFSVYFHSEFIFLSTSRTEWKKKWWVRTGCESIDQHHAYAYRLSFPFLVFRHLSLSPPLSPLPLPLRKLRRLLSRFDRWKRITFLTAFH